MCVCVCVCVCEWEYLSNSSACDRMNLIRVFLLLDWLENWELTKFLPQHTTLEPQTMTHYYNVKVSGKYTNRRREFLSWLFIGSIAIAFNAGTTAKKLNQEETWHYLVINKSIYFPSSPAGRNARSSFKQNKADLNSVSILQNQLHYQG